MAKKSVIAGEYIIQVEDNKHVTVVRIPRNAKATMVGIAEARGFAYDESWTTQDFGRHLCHAFGDGKSAVFGDITITRNPKVEIVQDCSPVRPVLVTICEKLGMEYQEDWNTQTLGNRLVDFLEQHKDDADKLLQTPNRKRQ